MTVAADKPCYRCKEAPRAAGAYCRPCASEYERDRRNKNKDEINARVRKRYDPAKRFEQKLRYQYNLTLAQYQEILDRQGGVCAICKKDAQLHVDHDHACCPKKEQSCGKCVRGLLCGNCNNGLGRFQDDIDRLEGAIRYLRG